MSYNPVSKPGQALPPPTSTAARFSGLSGAMVGPSGALALLFCCLWCRWCSGRRVACLVGRAARCARGRRPARSPSAPRAFGSARRLEARPGPATAHGHRSQVLRSLRRPPHRWRLACWRVDRRVVSKPSYGRQSASLHVILLSLIQILNLHRWNCNVFEVSRKMTAINYVRDLPGGGIVTARVAPQPGSPVPPAPSTPVVMGVWQHEEPSVSVQAACRRRV